MSDWDGNERRAPDELRRWRGEMDRRVDSIEAQMQRGADRFDRIEANLRTNTTLTGVIDARTQKIEERLAPVADALDTMQTGIKVLGGIGKVGLFLAKHWYVLVGAWLFVKVVVHGDGWEAAVSAFWKGVTGK